MGFIKAFSGALGGSLADTWIDFIKETPEDPAAIVSIARG